MHKLAVVIFGITQKPSGLDLTDFSQVLRTWWGGGGGVL